MRVVIEHNVLGIINPRSTKEFYTFKKTGSEDSYTSLTVNIVNTGTPNSENANVSLKQ